MSNKRPYLLPLACAALALVGCTTTEMKGTPFYTGEYAVNVPGADERRVNLWPLAYSREPALSVLWPVFELTEEHVALRPLFSAYGDTERYWEYNLLWPLCQTDTRSDDHRVFPYFWGSEKRGDGRQSYHALFPLLWHKEDEYHALFPLWAYNQESLRDESLSRDLWLLWPLLRRHTSAEVFEWHAGLFGRYADTRGTRHHTGFPWPLLFSWRDPERHGLFTPLYAYEACENPAVRDGWDALPLLLSWRSREGDSQSLVAAAGLYGQLSDRQTRSGWLLPLCGYDTRERLLLTPLFGWDRPDADDPEGYWYPLTPLAGVRTGAHRGGWLFPLFSHRASATNGTYETQALLLGHAERAVRKGSAHSSERRTLSFFPLFSHAAYDSSWLDRANGASNEQRHREDHLLLLAWTSSGRTVQRRTKPDAQAGPDSVTTVSDSGLFPLWRSESRTTVTPDGAPLRHSAENALLLALYDTRQTRHSPEGDKPALDYTRRRVLWRVWHYERRNGDVSVDLFPAITYDVHADGFRKTSFLWRLYRHETSRDGKTSLDLLFLPLLRDR